MSHKFEIPWKIIFLFKSSEIYYNFDNAQVLNHIDSLGRFLFVNFTFWKMIYLWWSKMYKEWVVLLKWSDEIIDSVCCSNKSWIGASSDPRIVEGEEV